MHQRIIASIAVIAGLQIAGIIPEAAAAPMLQTYVISVGGQSTLGPNFQCATFGAPAASGDFFSGAGVGRGVAIPTDGLGTCGVAGGFNAKSATSGPLTDSASLSTTFNAGANSFTGSSSASAQYGKIGAKAQGTFTGLQNSFIVDGAQGDALFREPLKITSPTVANGTLGQIVYTFTVDGHMSAVGPGTSVIDVVYEQNSGPNFILMRATVDPRDNAPFITSPTNTGLSGFTPSASPGNQSISGSGAFDTFPLSFVWGTEFEIALGIRAMVLPAIGSNEVDFSTAALLTGIDVYANGQLVENFSIESGSGTRYDTNGVHFDPPVAVPEPGTLACFGAGLIGLTCLRRRRAPMPTA
jgi:hypothetical protein